MEEILWIYCHDCVSWVLTLGGFEEGGLCHLGTIGGQMTAGTFRSVNHLRGTTDGIG